MAYEYAQVVSEEWVTFQGGELEGRRPRTLCPDCREALKREALGSSGPSGSSSLSRPSRPLCFQCYRADLDRQRAMAAAGELDTASEARFQFQLPLEPVNTARLEMLKADRASARTAMQHGVGPYVDQRRQAQIAARHALQAIAAGLKARQLAPVLQSQAMAPAVHAAELQLPDSWIPFVVSRP
jgi:hypothetical protein